MSYAEPLTELIDAVVDGSPGAVDLAFEALPQLQPGPPARPTITSRQRRDTFERDRYQCRYCGTKLILSDVLALLTVIDPMRFPWHRNWKTGLIHPAFPSSIPTVDHVIPVVLGGDDSPENLVTACWPCNTAKRDSPLSQQLVAANDLSWSGLTDRYRLMWEVAGRPEKFRWSVDFFTAPRKT